jgi:hypothetical protein
MRPPVAQLTVVMSSVLSEVIHMADRDSKCPDGLVFALTSTSALTGAVLALFVDHNYNLIGKTSEKSDMLYADVAVLVLTCVTIIITCAALVIAMLGIWGFQKIKEDAVATAVTMSLERVEKEISEGGDLRKLLLVLFSEFENRHSGGGKKGVDWGDENREYGE